MMRYATAALLLLALSIIAVAEARDNFLKLPSEIADFFHPKERSDAGGDSVGTRWAVLIAGSNGYWNYRHLVIKSVLLTNCFILLTFSPLSLFLVRLFFFC